jgi:hypothetical protein
MPSWEAGGIALFHAGYSKGIQAHLIAAFNCGLIDRGLINRGLISRDVINRGVINL